MNYGMVPPPEHVHTRPHGDTTEKEKRYNELTRGYTTTRSSTWLRSEPLSRMTRELDILEIQNVINFDVAREYKMEREQQLQGQPNAGGAAGVGFGSGARQRTGLGYTAASTMMMGQGAGTVASGVMTMQKRPWQTLLATRRGRPSPNRRPLRSKSNAPSRWWPPAMLRAWTGCR